jgi:hypothetical protein
MLFLSRTQSFSVVFVHTFKLVAVLLVLDDSSKYASTSSDVSISSSGGEDDIVDS